MKEIKTCEICENTNLMEFLNLGDLPLCDDLIKIDSNKISKKYPVKLLFCNKCKTVHQKWQIEKEILFNKDYHYRAHITKTIVNSLKNFCDATEEFIDLNSTTKVLDIGCNDGTLLNFFKQKGAQTFGVEPSDAIKRAKNNGHSTTQDYFNSKLAIQLKEEGIVPDLITFTNAFAHIEDLRDLCEAIKIISNEKTLLAIENHYLGSILKKNHFDTFYHEHPRTYSVKSFEYIAKKLSLDILKVEFPDRDGGNIRLILGKKEYFKNNNFHIKDEIEFEQEILLMQKKTDKWKKNCKKLIKKLLYLNENKPLVAKAFPGRATILLNLLNLDEKTISKVYEITGSVKTGYYVPGTRIPIKPEEELFKGKSPRYIINLAWHLSKAVRKNLNANNISSEIFDIVNEKMMK